MATPLHSVMLPLSALLFSCEGSGSLNLQDSPSPEDSAEPGQDSQPGSPADSTQGAEDSDSAGGRDSSPPGYDPTEGSLRYAAAAAGKELGVAVHSSVFGDSASWAALVQEEFSLILPISEYRWPALQSEPDSWTTEGVDRLAELSAAYELPLHAYAMVEPASIPSWTEGLDQQALQSALERHLGEVQARWAGSTGSWGLTHAPFSEEGELRAGPLLSQWGEDWLSEVYQIAQEQAPGMPLFLSNPSMGAYSDATSAALDWAEQINEQEAVLSGVSLSLQLRQGDAPTPEDLRTNIRRFESMGLEVHLSDLAVPIGHLRGAESERLLAQAVQFYELTTACVAEPGCTRLSFWGLSDQDPWVREAYDEEVSPLLYQGDLQPKPARQAVLEALMGEPMTGCEDSRLRNGGFEKGASSWTSWNGQLESITEPVHDGNRSIRVFERTATWSGPVQDVLERIGEGLIYEGQAQVRLPAGSAEAYLTLYWLDEAGDHWVQLDTVEVDSQDWTELRGQIDLSSERVQGELEAAMLYVEGPPAGVDLLVDSMLLRPICPQPQR